MIRMSIRLAACLLSATLAVPGFAQAPAPAPPGTTAVPIPNATPTHLACARELVELSGMGRTFLSFIPQLMRDLNQTVTRTRPELIPDMKAVLDALQGEFYGYTKEMTETSARVYTALLTEVECSQAVTFFRSDSGRKYVDAQPSIFANIGPALEIWNKSLSVRMFDRVREEMRKKGHEL